MKIAIPLTAGLVFASFVVSDAMCDDLISQLQSGEVQQRIAAAKALGVAKASTASLDQLRKSALDDEAPAVRAASCEALGAHAADPDKTIPVLIDACSDGDEHEGEPVYQSAGTALAKFKTKSMPLLQQMLASGETGQIIKAGLALDHVGPYAASLVDTLVPILERHRERELIPCINAIRRIGKPASAAVPVLHKLLDHENFHVRYWTCRALSEIGPAAAPTVDRLIEMLKTDNASVRRHAAQVLGKIGAAAGDKAVDALVIALSDSFQLVQANSAIALSEMMPIVKRVEGEIQAAIDKPAFNARAQAAQALWRIDPGSQEAIDVLLKQLNDKRSPYDVVEVVAAIGAEMMIAPEIAAALKSESGVVRESAAMCLAELGNQARPYLNAIRDVAENDKDEEVREVAQAAIQVIEASKPDDASR